MREVACLRSSALDDFGVLRQHGIEFGNQGHDFRRKFAIQPGHFAAAHLAQRSVQGLP